MMELGRARFLLSWTYLFAPLSSGRFHILLTESAVLSGARAQQAFTCLAGTFALQGCERPAPKRHGLVRRHKPDVCLTIASQQLAVFCGECCKSTTVKVA
jgi:hypothetical protein